MAMTIQPREMRALEQRFMEERGIPGLLLMEHAAAGIVRALRDIAAGNQPVLFLCGPGNNGGDGYAAARLWQQEGARSLIWELSSSPSGDALINRRLALDCGIPAVTLAEAPDALPACAAVVDALFGTGLNRAPEGLAAALIRLVNRSRLPVLAVDIPSGLNGEDGSVPGEAIRADVTVTFHRLKAGLLLKDACAFSGRIIRWPILIPEDYEEVPGLSYLENSDLPALIPPRGAASHKGTWGRAVLLVGSEGMAGAAALCAAACIRGGCGLTRVLCPPAVLPVVQRLVPGATVTPLTGDGEANAALARECLRTADRAAIGCGIGTGDHLLPLLKAFRDASCPVVWDADALNLLARYPALLPLKAEDIITPHPGEAARLLQMGTGDIRRDPLSSLRQLHDRCGCRVILKEARSLMTDGKGIAVNPIGTPALAKGGSGDMLTGLLTALLGRTSAADAPLAELQAACYLHTAAAMRAELISGRDSVTPEEIAACIRLYADDLPMLNG